MITADPYSVLGCICRDVDAMTPGQRLKISRGDLRGIPSLYHNETLFTPPDRVLGNIVGSAYTHSYTVDPMSGDVTFRRHEDIGEVRHRAPDRR